jgi:hypothetical protein
MARRYDSRAVVAGAFVVLSTVPALPTRESLDARFGGHKRARTRITSSGGPGDATGAS